MKKFEKTILKDLFKSVEGLYAFTLYSRYKVEPEELSIFIEKYQKKGILSFQNDRLYLTSFGKEQGIKQKLFFKKAANKFENIPNEFIGEKIKINTPYLPDVDNISEEILKK